MADPLIMNEIISWTVGAPAIGVVVAYGISMIRRRASADTKALLEDKSYQDMLDSYRKERDDIRAERDRVIARLGVVEGERNDSVGKVGKLTAEVEFLSIQVTELKTLVEKLSVSLDSARVDMHRYAVENAKFTAHVSYLEDVVNRSIGVPKQ